MPTRSNIRLLFAVRLREFREQAGYPSQRSLGTAMGLKGSNKGARINRYESGASGTNLDELDRLADMLGVPAAALIAEDKDIAEAIRLLSELPTRKRKQFLKMLREQVE